MTKSKKPIFSDRVIAAMMELDQKTLKRVLGNMDVLLKTTAKNNIRIVPKHEYDYIREQLIIQKIVFIRTIKN